MEKDLNYWKKNAEEDYMTVPISVLRYITELEKAVDGGNSDKIFPPETGKLSVKTITITHTDIGDSKTKVKVEAKGFINKFEMLGAMESARNDMFADKLS